MLYAKLELANLCDRGDRGSRVIGNAYYVGLYDKTGRRCGQSSKFNQGNSDQNEVAARSWRDAWNQDLRT